MTVEMQNQNKNKNQTNKTDKGYKENPPYNILEFSKSHSIHSF